jgi:CRISPR-associated endonuclease Csn1
MDIFELPNGRWAGEAVSIFSANQSDYRPRWIGEHPKARLVMRVHKGDLLRLEHNGAERVMRVVRLRDVAQQLMLAEHVEAGQLADRHNATDDPFEWLYVSINKLKARHARKVTVDVLGRVNDPGFKS